MAGVVWRELTERVIKKQVAADVHKTEDKIYLSVSKGVFAKERILVGLRTTGKPKRNRV